MFLKALVEEREESEGVADGDDGDVVLWCSGFE